MNRQVVFVAAVSLMSFALQAAAITPAEVRVKKAIADQMSPEELAAYKQRLADRYNQGAFDKAANPNTILTPADACTGATPEISGLPYAGPADTTVGATDNYDLPADTASPTCSVGATCTGAGPAGSLPAGAIYTGTGTAPDRAYRFETSANCTLTITATPTTAFDISLIVYQANCSSNLADCACVDDTGVSNQAESVTLSAVAGTVYYAVVDGYSSGATPPGPSGAFNLGITGTGCTLVPVELQSFEVSK